jgi:hypothetical protein
MKRFFPPFAAALALALAAAPQSHADTMIRYNWNDTPSQISTVPQFPQLPGQAGTGGVNLVDLNTHAVQADATIGTGNPAVDIQSISSAQAKSSAWPQGMDVIPGTGGHYTLTLTIYAKDPSKFPGTASATVSFNGQLQGSLTALSSNLTNTILSSKDSNGTVHVGGQAATAMLGNIPITVSYSGFAEPGNTVDQSFGAISFKIKAGGGTVVGGQNPEPSSMILGCLGLSFVGGVVWRARRRKLAALKAVA